MAIRKLSAIQQTEITHAYKSGDFHEKELATYYGVSCTTIRHVLANAGLMVDKAYKTKDQVALLEHLQVLGITTVSEYKARSSRCAKGLAHSLFNSLPLEVRTQWLVESVQGKQLPEGITDFDTPQKFKEEEHGTHSRNSTQQIPLIQ